MEFESLHIENFGSIENIDIKLNQPGLILILGVNKDSPKCDSNGSGKSLLFEALCWCIWGETIRELDSDDVVNRIFGKNCLVQLSLTDGVDKYLISRHRKDCRNKKPNDLSLIKNGISANVKNNIKNLQKVVDTVIGFDFNTFCAMMPGTGIKVSNMTDLQIKTLLERLLQTEQLSNAHDIVNNRLKSIQIDLLNLDNRKQMNLLEIDSLKKSILELQTLKENVETYKQKELEQYEEQLKFQNQIMDSCAETIQIEKAVVDRIASLDKEREELKLQLRNLVDVQTGTEKELRSLIYRKEVDITNLKKKLDFQEEGVCDSCGQNITLDHIAVHRQAFQKEITMLQRESRLVRERLSELVSAYETQRWELNNKIDECLGLKTQETVVFYEIHHAKSRQLEVSKVIHSLNNAIQRVKEQTTHKFDIVILEKEKDLKTLLDTVKTQTAQDLKLQHELKLANFWLKGFSPAGLRSFMLNYVTPILNDRAAYYSNLLTDGDMDVTFSTKTTLKSGETREKFQVIVDQKHGANAYKGISKGEKARADLIISMALGDLAAFRTAKQLPWRFLDEPFESIDTAGTDAIIRLLNDQKARYKTVFVVTHQADFKQMFSQTLTVMKEKGITKLI